eukprot:6492320-Amphidinium_carterae.2
MARIPNPPLSPQAKALAVSPEVSKLIRAQELDKAELRTQVQREVKRLGITLAMEEEQGWNTVRPKKQRNRHEAPKQEGEKGVLALQPHQFVVSGNALPVRQALLGASPGVALLGSESALVAAIQ